MDGYFSSVDWNFDENSEIRTVITQIAESWAESTAIRSLILKPSMLFQQYSVQFGLIDFIYLRPD